MQSQDYITGTVSKVLYDSDIRQIILINTIKGAVKVVINAPLQLVEPNDHISVRGSFDYHSKYGAQFIADDISHRAVTQELIKSFLMSSNGIGEKTAGKIIEGLGDNILTALEDKDVDRIYNHGKISKAAAEIVCHNWHKQAGKVQLMKFMNELLRDTKPAKRNEMMNIGKSAYQYYGVETEQKLKEDPYRIWSFCSFNQASLLGNALSVPSDDKRRLICAVEEVLYKQLDAGHTRSSPLVFASNLAKLIGDDLVIKALYAASKESEQEWPRFVVTEPNDTSLTELEKLYARHFALPSAVIMENYVKEELLSRINNGILNIQVTYKELRDYKIGGGHYLSDEQQNAVKTILSNAVTCISGGAGTGKTSVLFCAHGIITNAGSKVLQVALSGKAARRLAQQTEQDAMTIEKLLKKVEREPDYLNQFPSPLVLIDEASMVDLHTMYRLLTILAKRPARLVFVGDWAQLPPVGPGLIYHQLMRSKLVPTAELKKNFRSVKEINIASSAVKNGELFESCKVVRIIECDSAEKMKEVAKREYQWNISVKSVHVIAARTRTVADINISLQELITHMRKIIPCAPHFREGDAVVYKANNEVLGLVNGSTGIVLSGSDDSITVKFDIEGVIAIPKENIIQRKNGEYLLQHGFALTCHSAQGSEFDVVIVVVEDMPLVERSWLYTAMTRAKKKVILVTTKNGIKNAIDAGFKAHQIDVGFHL
jgi:exodeoxyribonuclease V alpha subunit